MEQKSQDSDEVYDHIDPSIPIQNDEIFVENKIKDKNEEGIELESLKQSQINDVCEVEEREIGNQINEGENESVKDESSPISSNEDLDSE